ncbi:hypothetical protein [Ruegeria arenilitoris]|uniref:hypothetical protein n=1 Tax=Ruegeria arenilitoris TaxID=1173585 RepID=UPI00147C715D|nr:hypothetical protein [Ruegeria arenilitoris]
MTSDTTPRVLENSEARRLERASSLTDEDFHKLWEICGQEGNYSADFSKRVREAVYFYFPGRSKNFAQSAKERNRFYGRLEKSIGNLREQLDSIHDDMVIEIDWGGDGYEPEGFDLKQAADFGVFTYGGYLLYTLQGQLEDFAEIVATAKKENGNPRGKPKQNEALESTISDLGDIYRDFSGKAPMAGYRYDELDERQPYKGPFFDFLHGVLWTVNGRDYPTSNTLGDTARRLFKLRK